jgi:hypothetical protein
LQLKQLDFKLAAVVYHSTGSINPLALLEVNVLGILAFYALESQVKIELLPMLHKQYGTVPYCQVASWMGRSFKLVASLWDRARKIIFAHEDTNRPRCLLLSSCGHAYF